MEQVVEGRSGARKTVTARRERAGAGLADGLHDVGGAEPAVQTQTRGRASAAPRHLDPRILVIDPDPVVGGSPSLRMLQQNGFWLELAPDAERARNALSRRRFSMIVLETAAEEYDGQALCREILEATRAPVLVWSHKADPLDEVMGLELGAHDYVAKSAHPLVLFARTRALLRRGRSEAGMVAPAPSAAQWVLSPPGVLRASTGKRVTLSAQALEIFVVLCERAGEVIPRDSLLKPSVGSGGARVRNADSAVGRLRRRIRDCAGADRLVRTIHGEGYILAADVQATPRGYVLTAVD